MIPREDPWRTLRASRSKENRAKVIFDYNNAIEKLENELSLKKQYIEDFKNVVMEGGQGVTEEALGQYVEYVNFSRSDRACSVPIYSHYLMWKLNKMRFREYFLMRYREQSINIAILKWMYKRSVITLEQSHRIAMEWIGRKPPVIAGFCYIRISEKEYNREVFIRISKEEGSFLEKDTEAEILLKAAKVLLKSSDKRNKERWTSWA